MNMGFVIPAATPGSPDSAARRRKMAEAMMAQSMAQEPIRSPWQGASKMAQALMAGLISNKADSQEQAGRAAANEALVKALQGGQGVAPSQSDPNGDFVQALNNPWMSQPGQAMLMDKWQQMNTPPDPMKALQQQKLQLEIQKMGQPDTPTPTDDMREYEMAKSQGFTGTFQDYMIGMKKAGASNTSVSVGGGSDKQIFDETKARADAARAASTGLGALNQAQTALPGAITGAAANERLALQKVGALFGVGDTNAIQDTETFKSAIAPQVAAMMKATVGSTQISNADREFAQKAAGGDITLDASSLQRLINIMRVANSEIVRGFNSDLGKIYPDGQGFDRERALFNVPNAPKAYSAPIGLEMPDGMSPAAPPPAAPQSNATPDPSAGFDLGEGDIPEGAQVIGEDGNRYWKRNGKLFKDSGNGWEPAN